MLVRLSLPAALVALFILLAPTVVATHSDAGSTDNANPDTWMDGEYVVTFGDDLANLTLEVTIGIHKMTYHGFPVNSSVIREEYAQRPDADARAAYLQPLETALGTALNETMDSMFPGKPRTTLVAPGLDAASLAADATGPVLFTASERVALTPGEEGLGAYGAPQIEAAFKAGAVIRTTRVLAASPGHTNTFLMTGPSYAQFTGATSTDPAHVLDVQNGVVSVVVDAADRTDAEGPLTSAPVTLTLADTSQTPPTAEDILVRTRIRMQPFERYDNGTFAPGLPFTTEVVTELGALNLTARMPGLATPDAVTLPGFITADGVRLLYQRGIVTDDHLRQAEDAIGGQTQSDIDRTFGGTNPLSIVTPLDPSGAVSDPLSTDPPLVFTSRTLAPIYFDIGADSNTADAALEAGAIVTFDMTLYEDASLQQRYNFTLPPALAYMDDPELRQGAFRAHEVPDDTKQLTLTLRVGDPTVRRATSEVVRNHVEVSIPAMAGMQDPTIPLAIVLGAEVESLGVVTRFPGVLPDNVELPFLTAEGLRILKARGVIAAADLARAEGDILQEMRSTLAGAFPAGVTMQGGFRNESLQADAAPLEPARFEATAVALHDIGATGDRADAGLQVGAIVNTTFTFTGKAKQHTSYALHLPSGLHYFDGATPGPSTLEVEVDATASATDLTVELPARFGKNMTRADRGDLRVELGVAIEPFRSGVDGIPVRADIVANLHAVDVREKFPDALPDNVELAFLSHDGFRLLYQRGIITEEALANATRDLNDDLTQRLAGTFGSGVVVNTTFDRASFTSANGTPVRMVSVATMVKRMGDATPQQAEIILEAGAVVGQSMNLTGIEKADTRYTITVPQSMAFKDVVGADVVDLRTLRLHLDGRNTSEAVKAPIRFKLYNPSATVYTEQDARIDIVIDMKLDLSVLEAARTRDGSMELGVDAVVNLGVIEIPADLRSKLPADVQITHIPIDALRRLWQVGALNESQVARIESEFTARVADGLKGIAGKPVAVSGGLARSQLEKPVTGPLSGDDPVKLTASATIHKSLLGGTKVNAPGEAAITLYAVPLSLPLQSFQGLPTVYKVILPTGLSFAKADAGKDASIETGTMPDGREYMVATVAGGKTATAAMSIAITPALLVDQFLPWLIGIGLVLALMVILPILGIVRLVRRRRNKGKGAA